ncbi:MAG: nucleotidyltransferase family protein [Gemmatimonadetes bacterium]|nr:nucleotidyltransferase family protein [Gemmatimonadota bacterium]
MTVREQVRLLRREILDAAEANGARRIRLFGSAARGQETGESDVDLLVTLEPGRTLMDLARLEARLERLLNRIVDVVPESGLREPFRSSVLRDAIDV